MSPRPQLPPRSNVVPARRLVTDRLAPPPTTYMVAGEKTSPLFSTAFARGCGGPILNVKQDRLGPGAFAAFCTPPTWALLDRAIESGRDYYYGDHAFYQRGKYYRVTKNAIQYQPTPAEIATATPHRFEVCGQNAVPAWKRTGRHIVFCPNSVPYLSQFAPGGNGHDWVLTISRQLARYTDRPIIARWKAQAKTRPLPLDLADAWAVVVFNSNAAVEALQAGVPVFVLDAQGAAATMGSGDLTRLETPVYPDDRIPFLWALAQHQWTLSEIASGRAWRTLQGDPPT